MTPRLFLSSETDTDPGGESQIEHNCEGLAFFFFLFLLFPYFYLLLRSPVSDFCPVDDSFSLLHKLTLKILKLFSSQIDEENNRPLGVYTLYVFVSLMW